MGTWTPGPGATSGSDTFTGGATNESADGLGGDDTLIGGAGVDQVFGSAGNDILIVNEGDLTSGEIFSGGADTDTLRVVSTLAFQMFDFRSSTISGLERIEYGSTLGADTQIYFSTDQLGAGLSFTSTIVGSTLSDWFVVTSSGSAFTLDLSALNFSNWASNDLILVSASGQADVIVGTSYGDGISALGGDDNLSGGDGGDFLGGNEGNDTVDGGNGADELTGGPGMDQVLGGEGDDVLIVNEGDAEFGIIPETYDGGNGTDTLRIITSSFLAEFDFSGINVANLERVEFIDNNLNFPITATTFSAWQFGAGSISTSAVFVGSAGDNDVIISISQGSMNINLSGLTLIDWELGYDEFYFYGGLLADDITGTSQVDYINGDADADTLAGVGGDDFLDGGDGADLLDGGAANDWLTGGADADTLYGRAGSDTLDGGNGADTMFGGDGDDQYYVDNAGDVATDHGPSGGLDTVNSTVTFTLGAAIERLLLTGVGAINGTGNDLGNLISGNGAANILNGRLGQDELYGYGGLDTLYGGDGNDTALGGDDADLLDGGNNDDTLFGDGGDDTLYGRAGIDTLDGGTGADTMFGGAGDDTYYVDNAGDLVGESASSGNDTIVSSVTRGLGQYQENLTLTGVDNLNGTGNVLANTINGNVGANALSGLAGADAINADAGDDTVFGGDGNDTLYGGAGADLLDGGNDLDTIYGGFDADTIYGRAGNDILSGNEGDDFLYGGDGVDLIYGDAGDDFIDGGNGADILLGIQGGGVIYGRNGDDFIDGGFGSPTVYGGNDADTFVFRTAIGFGNIVTIGDYNVAADTIQLSANIYTTLSQGALAANAFVIGTAAADADDRIIYDPVTGALYYDADGDGGGAAVQFATLATGLALTNADFVVGP